MNHDQALEKVYEWVEQVDFQELSIENQKLALTVLTQQEYAQMRTTIKATQGYFATESAPTLKATSFNPPQRPNALIRFMKQPVPLYKVAASALLMVGIYSGFRVIKSQPTEGQTAQNRTIEQVKTDTVFVTIMDTLEVIKEQIVYVEKQEIPKLALVSHQAAESATKQIVDCAKELCPEAIDKLKNMSSHNEIGNDRMLKQFLASIN